MTKLVNFSRNKKKEILYLSLKYNNIEKLFKENYYKYR